MQQLLIDGIMVAVTLSAVPMVVVAFVSGSVALIQAATQVQEQSVTHLVKICAFVAVMFIASEWASSEISELFERSLQAVEFLRKGSS